MKLQPVSLASVYNNGRRLRQLEHWPRIRNQATSVIHLQHFRPTMSKAKSFDSVLGRVPSGIFILTVGSGPRATGMLSSWVMQAGFEPPMVSVGVKLGRYVCDWLTEGQPFVLNLVGESQNRLAQALRQRL